MFPCTQQVKPSLRFYFAFVTEGDEPTPVGCPSVLDLRGAS